MICYELYNLIVTVALNSRKIAQPDSRTRAYSHCIKPSESNEHAWKKSVQIC